MVVGDGPERTRLERHVRAIGPSWPIHFTGRVPAPMLDDLFAQATVVTSASDYEAFGLTLAEGLASGARVVASAIPAHADLARQAGAGSPVALVDPRNTRQFADTLEASARRPGPGRRSQVAILERYCPGHTGSLFTHNCEKATGLEPGSRLICASTPFKSG